MKKEELSYIYLVLFHTFLGGLIFVMPFISKIYTLVIFVFGIYYIVKNSNKNNEALVISAYVISVEVLLRMTDGVLLNEFGKYSILIFMFLGMIYSGFSNKAIIYWLFLLLLIPGIILSAITSNFETDIRKAIAFNISGPVCLGISSIYCYQRKITFDRLKGVITAFSLPLVAIVIYLYLYTPSVRDVVTGTQSNFETSGGFGPNQVSTILGLGIFIFFVQLLLNSNSRMLQVINAGLVLVIAFRGIVTFSRGGVLTAVVMIFLLLIIMYFQANFNTKPKIGLIIIMSFLAGLGVWGYSSIQTGGLINKRYANQDARGREKKSQLSGREMLITSELQMFFDNPILGVGVGRNKEIREKETGIVAASHNEITRMLAEHGSLGLIDLVLLFCTPLILFANNRQNIFALSFLVFWLLTINHAAMRLAAPAFVYALSLLKVYTVEKPALHRK
ncbi:O-antigen ligase domain-containing protein [Flavobacterium aquariorum]|uniref:O-antigen ligase domain-containing protein n=1 Tax=Flavobacterium aquariorum TaxID=2217670 RepID=A0A2W7U5D2_9FLAO|nr:O-antigen ligase family protein [Flavobacterium aquariorum]PZX92439.1 O-antigen ligase domain-containing protein [Flavobacterium aquariorum]